MQSSSNMLIFVVDIVVKIYVEIINFDGAYLTK